MSDIDTLNQNEPDSSTVKIEVHGPAAIDSSLIARLSDASNVVGHPDLRWLLALRDGLNHVPYCIEASRDGNAAGVLPLAFVSSGLFGRYLVSLPYLNTGGIQSSDRAVAAMLVDRAVELADELQAKRLELRHETEHVHASLTQTMTSKVHMRLRLPDTADSLWDRIKSKVRNQIRKGEKQEFTVSWGGEDVLQDFYHVFSRNMRDLGTPVFGKELFRALLSHFPDDAEMCVVRLKGKPVATALLVHGSGVTEVPSASTLREYNSTNANMFMYWQLLKRAIERGQDTFDFGRSSKESNTYRFKKQWGAEPHPAVWQYYVREGDIGDMRPENSRYQQAIRIWQRLPVWLTRLIGPRIVRGIP